ncbi:hypothetical protein IKJ53_07100 [bacterium]|nr:hypothetical protein [bacterium]
MKIGSITTKICKSKCVKNGLELAANNGFLFNAGTQLALATTLRPISIALTPKTEKENKKLACAKSFGSALTNFMLVLGVSTPIAKNVKKIDLAPEKYLSPKVIERMKEGSKPLIESKSYQFATQLFKLGANVITAAPRAIITCAMIPPMLALIQNGKTKGVNGVNGVNGNNGKCSSVPQEKQVVQMSYQRAQSSVFPPNNRTSFKGKIDLAKGMGKVIESPSVQNFAEKYKNTNLPMHTMALTDALTTATLCHRVNKSKNIDDDRKRVLNNNSMISTSIGILTGYVADKATNKSTEKFINKFSELNKGNPKLSKYVEGIKIVKPMLLYGGIYYGLIPLVSTFFAERINKEKVTE